jgi:hypothetical protein
MGWEQDPIREAASGLNGPTAPIGLAPRKGCVLGAEAAGLAELR